MAYPPSRQRLSPPLAWLFVTAICAVTVIAWGSTYRWHVWPLSVYLLFPLLGLLAFGIMWSHYMVGAAQRLLGLEPGSLGSYFRWTGYAVLALICLHPGLLIYQRFRDGYGLPPGSYESYVAPSLAWVTLLGTASLLIFLAFELHRFFAKRRWWRYVADASDVAMLAIIYHGLKLGSQLVPGSWFRIVWLVYGLTLVGALIYKYYGRYEARRAKLRTAASIRRS